ncbi:MAG: acetyl/propionyl/methylcrotonyl-CoA carboxylase subunit alpha [Candidatus Pacebacteria bacterium]|nr:acetyl/propionyl/methylcrotonyl-CoA carboxylase subunit alpha [Candidatus Paceibacterota bacterium]
MFKSILIANRGEISCRIIRSAQKMGIKAYALYSDADEESLAVRLADDAVRLPGMTAAETYLDIGKVVAAAKSVGAEAVAPGYGFLSERTEFAEALKAAGIVFIGPNPLAIAAMGDKIESKKRARAAQVSTVPGFLGAMDNEAEAIKVAKEIGYPVILKASAGGGGKGMRVIRSDGEMKEALRATKAEARSSFGDDRVFLEKYIDHPRHIEIQVLGDKHGHIIHLGERECSLQRRHQKVIEEAPSPFLDAKTREAMGSQAVALAREVGYDSAGTVEFIVDQDKNFYFLEMNTRLQVEHPVTEMVTGVDLVEQMIRIAAGEKLKLKQSDIKMTGWSMEARVYAEDPARNFLPAIGRLTRYRQPQGEGIRIDTGVFEGSEISVYYDPMIAKLISYGESREVARNRLSQALDEFDIKGLNHNLDFLSSLTNHKKFISGDISTHLIAEDYPEGFVAAPPMGEGLDSLLAIAAARHHAAALRDSKGRRYSPPSDWVVYNPVSTVTAHVVAIDLAQQPHRATVMVDSRKIEVVGSLDPALNSFSGQVNGLVVTVLLRKQGRGFRLSRASHAVTVSVLSPLAAELSARMPAKIPPDHSKEVRSPMPGLLVAVMVKPGDEVKEGDSLAIIEAMKMENILKAEKVAKVKKVNAQKGDSLAVDQVIIEFA